MKTIVHVDGLADLDAALGELPKATAKAVLRRVGIRALQPVAEAARGLAPDDPETGGYDLRNSIAVSTRLSARQRKQQRRDVRAGAEKSFVEVYAGAGPLPQAHLMEFGTANTAPQPFLRPAWAQERDGVLKTIADNLGDEIIKTAKRVATNAARKAARAG